MCRGSRGFKVRRRRAGFIEAFELRKLCRGSRRNGRGAGVARHDCAAIRAALGCGADTPGLLRPSGRGNCAAIRAALRCGADAPDFPSPVGWGNCAALAARSRFVLVVSRLMARRRTVEEVPRWLAKSARASVPSSVSAGGTRAETETRRRQRPRRARRASEERRDSRGFKVRRLRAGFTQAFGLRRLCRASRCGRDSFWSCRA